MHLRDGSNRLGAVPVLGEDVAECHRETGRVRRGDQLLWVGALALLETGRERIAALEHTVTDGEVAFPALEVPAPFGATTACCHLALLSPLTALIRTAR